MLISFLHLLAQAALAPKPVMIPQPSYKPVAHLLQSHCPAVTITSSTPTTLLSSPYPAANGSVYTATNKPLPTLSPQLQSQTAEPSLSFEIISYTTFSSGRRPPEYHGLTNHHQCHIAQRLPQCMCTIKFSNEPRQLPRIRLHRNRVGKGILQPARW